MALLPPIAAWNWLLQSENAMVAGGSAATGLLAALLLAAVELVAVVVGAGV
ncbi:MAG TPA: hypothetical protein VMB79_06460 [Jatrophihabitans sp.]|nr:hypothetical protein [Jatrophihabitans sp.]